jgi:hypothetical protein
MRVDAAGHTVSFPIWLHRPLPANGRVKQATLSWRRQGEKIVGTLSLLVSIPTSEYSQPNDAVSACGIDLGWRKMDDGGLLVATVVQGDNSVSRITLSPRWMGGMDQVERLSSHIDEGLLEVAQQIILLGNTVHPLLQVPVASWRLGLGARHVNATALHNAVRELQFSVPPLVLHWYQRYRHLSVWRDNLRNKLIKQRREQYRLTAREITIQNRIVGIEDMDIAAMALVKKSDTGDNELNAVARAQRVRADVSLLRQEIIHQAKKNGCEITMATKDTTARCHVCGEVTRQSDRTKIMWRCEHCNAIWDQDINAATNLMEIATGLRAAA